MLKNNLALKLVGLLIAALIWLQIAFQTEQQSVLNLPLELTSAAEGKNRSPPRRKCLSMSAAKAWTSSA